MKLEQLKNPDKLRSVKDYYGTLKSPYDHVFRVPFGAQTLIGSPDICEDDFSSVTESLQSLEGGPSRVGGHFSVNYCRIENLVGSPKYVRGAFDCSNNPLLKTFDGLNVELEHTFSCYNIRIESLHMIHKKITKMGGGFFASINPGLTKDLLGLLLIPGLTSISIDNKDIAKILNSHLKNPNKKLGMLQCQQELIDAGFEEAARL